MDGLYWKTLLKLDDLEGKPTILGNIHMLFSIKKSSAILPFRTFENTKLPRKIGETKN